MSRMFRSPGSCVAGRPGSGNIGSASMDISIIATIGFTTAAVAVMLVLFFQASKKKP